MFDALALGSRVFDDKKPFSGLSGHSWSLVVNEMVEAAGIEPASVSPLPKALHA